MASSQDVSVLGGREAAAARLRPRQRAPCAGTGQQALLKYS